jgi:apolipoprotein N-acyltransferase
MAIDSRGEIVGAVDKVHLVPFGEYVPLAGLLDRFGISQFVAGPMNFTAGTARQPLELPGGARVAAFICYEVIFPAEVVIDVASANIIVNVTNDAWFGRSPGPYQHFRQAQLRAVEAGLPLVRAANTGLSGATDAYGRIIDAFDLDARGEIDVRVPYGRAAVASAATPGKVGLGVVVALGLVAGAVGLRRRVRSN